MVKLFTALAHARDGVDMNAAFGEAAPRIAKIRNVVMVGLVVTVALLTVSHVKLHEEVGANRERADARLVHSDSRLDEIDQKLDLLLGQQRARAPRES